MLKSGGRDSLQVQPGRQDIEGLPLGGTDRDGDGLVMRIPMTQHTWADLDSVGSVTFTTGMMMVIPSLTWRNYGPGIFGVWRDGDPVEVGTGHAQWIPVESPNEQVRVAFEALIAEPMQSSEPAYSPVKNLVYLGLR